MQEGMLFHTIADPQKNSYFNLTIITIEGDFNVDLFEKSFNKLLERYDILRTNFIYDKFDELMQIVFKEKKGKVEYRDISNIQESEKNQYVKKYIEEDKKKGFDLKKDLLLRFGIIKTDNNKYKLIMSNHHIILDGWSQAIIVSDLLKIYNEFSCEIELNLDDVFQYHNYIDWLGLKDKDEAKEYWNGYLEGYNEKINLPFRKIKESGEISYRSKEVKLVIDSELTEKLEVISREQKITFNTIMQSIWTLQLQKYNNTNDVVFGFVVSGRNHEINGIENMAGLFINTIPMRMQIQEDITFKELAKQISTTFLSSSKYDYFPLAEIQMLSNMKNNLIDHIMVLENYPIDKEGLNFESYNEKKVIISEVEAYEKTNYDFNIIIENGNEITVRFLFNENVFDIEHVEVIKNHFYNIVKSITDNDEILLKDIQVIDIKEKELIENYNNTDIEYINDNTIQYLFEEQAEKTPNNLAIVCENKKVIYKELNERANMLANVLIDHGVKAGSFVGVMLERSVDLTIGIMAILKTGAAYIPIETSYPKERIKYILNNSNSDFLLTTDQLGSSLDIDLKILSIDDKDIKNASNKNLGILGKPSDIAYIIYTSGSTGNPKGVVISHKAVLNTIIDINTKFNVTEDDKILLISSVCFDLSVYDLFGALITGASVILVQDQKNIKRIIEIIDVEKATIWNSVPAFMEMIVGSVDRDFTNDSLRLVLLSGDWIPLKLPIQIKNTFTNAQTISLGGATEGSIWSIYYPIKYVKKEWRSIPYGMPLANQKMYILDKSLNLSLIGVPGEIFIGGVGVAEGYANDPKKTEASFMRHPKLGRIYKTGDLGLFTLEGVIEFLGRVDHQVKIHGFRIELGEIESNLLKLEGIKEAIVIDREENGNKYLCAYLIGDRDYKTGELRNELKKTLPEYMIPSYFMKIDTMPLTSNSKIDRKALPKPHSEMLAAKEYEAPRNNIEEKLVSIWEEILGVSNIGINDNFLEVGGHSLKAIILMGKIHKVLNVEVRLKEIFELGTIKNISNYINSKEESLYEDIKRIDEKEFYEASSAQKRMYILQQFEKDSMAYNMPVVFQLEGNINKERIEETFKQLISRHEALRTYFETFDDKVIQKLRKDYEFELTERKYNEDISAIVSEFIRPFELEEAPLFRIVLVESKGKMYLLIDMHHIISDGVSMSILIKEFTEMYSGKNLEPLKLQYKDFAVWQNNFLESEEMKKQEEYWINMFSDEIPVLNMPTDYERPAIQCFEGNSVNIEVDEKLTESLRKLTRETGTTMHMVLLSAFNILLSKYSGQEDIVIGTPIAGRPHADLQNIIGMFVNTLALRNKPEGDKKYIDFLKEVKENSLKAYENQSYQLEGLVEKLDVRRDTSRNPLFDVMFDMVDTVTGVDIKLDDVVLSPYSNENKVSKFDLTLNALENDEKLSFTIDYCSKLFKKETVERLSSHYVRILDSIANNVEIKLNEVNLLSETERNQILYEFNDTKADYPKDKTIHELFEVQVEKTPEKTAVVFENKKLTYRELNERANSLARVLRDKGVKADSIVGIMVERSLEMIVGIMGILKAGGAYLPLDPNCPNERIEYALKNSGSRVLLSKNALVETIEFDGKFIDLFNEDLFMNDSTNLTKINNSTNLAYVIYTSGTTGNPKGVMVEHRNGVNLLNCMQKKYPVEYNDVYLLKTNYVFDVSVTELFAWFIGCGSLAIMSENEQKDASTIIDSIYRYKVTHINFVPSMLSTFNEIIEQNSSKLKSLRYILSAGEELNAKLAQDLASKIQKIKLENLYGPTETTIYSSIYSVNKNLKYRSVPIGKPIQNTNLYVLNNNGVAPIGVVGELYIAGDGVTRGYLNRPELTAEKFVDNPFEPGTKMYKTGDLARWLQDGNIEFLGRMDSQVKIRGFRIELGEIENRLLKHEEIKEMAVIVRQDKENEKYICAYVVSEKSINELNLKSYLKKTLPEYMIPTYFMNLEKMPLTANGKFDRRVLPKPSLDGNLIEYEAPRNKVEEVLVRLWSEVLGIEKIGINDNFFDLGGHSLKATVLVPKIHKELNKEVPLKELFKAPTIKELSMLFENVQTNIYSNIEEVEEKEYYEASAAQKRMYMIQQLDNSSKAYNMPAVFELEGIINKEKIEETFKKLIIRHDALRTYFETYDGEIIQKLEKDYEFNLIERKDNEGIETTINKFVRPFNLDKSPLFRIELVESKEKTYLLIDMHHIISDGVSMNILIKEFVALYNDEILEPLRLQYKDFAAWQNKFLKSEEMKKQEEYWINRFNCKIPVLNLPYDYERTSIQSFEGNSVKGEINKEIIESLRKLAKETGSTMNMIILSAFNILLSKYSEQEDIIVGIPTAGRLHVELQNIIGMFVNTLALRNNLGGNKNYLEFLTEVKENCLEAYENQSYQFETLVKNLNLKRDLARNPLFDVMFAMDNMSSDYLGLNDLILKPYDNKNKISKVDLSLDVVEKIDSLELEIIYCKKLFDIETIEIMRDDLLNIIELISKESLFLIRDIVNKPSVKPYDVDFEEKLLNDDFDL